ncbi:MAG TPA: ImmA/IrrE family metallo-endopeptidase [Pseudoalteromonas prydzensis]|jgi:hypothetical protein|uniref:ImmA/IrrE family metallo-endopeptidase n=1 Tax=Pseudoalteromonas prydzensis TaxID=182141 RepID=A0A7V1D0W0_9GAMM|nr:MULTISPECIES: ImmA/IrrE family metallo-endopeptidase [Pseudoalteromonas]PKH93777.1 hypothetical protein CXF76_00105 [Pseudoalteromonas sp. 78C3]HEA17819.1 ImmA/IrrE family metallo-endopeptidase [Pseudoalteromonas prydzensis]
MSFSSEWYSLETEQQSLIRSFQGSLPIPIGAIARSLGINVKLSTLSAGISGEIREVENICTIKINRHDVKARQRFTLAHEIAHFLLHRDRLRNGIVDDVLYRSSLSNALEAEANRLAADIIMPWHLMKEAEQKYNALSSEVKFETIAEESELSTTAIKIRFGKL